MTYYSGDESSFYHSGKFILQNMQDSFQGRKCKLPYDEVKENSTLTNNEDICNGEWNDSDYDSFDDADSVDTYQEGEQGEDMAVEDDVTKRKLDDLKNGDDILAGHKMSSRVMSTNSLFVTGDSHQDNGDTPSARQSDSSHRRGYEQCDTANEYKTVLAFIGGATLSRAIDEDNGYFEGNIEGEAEDYDVEDGLFTSEEWDHLNGSERISRSSIPTMRGVSQKVAEEKGIILDKIQYVAYEIICSTFLLNVLRQSWEDQNSEEVSGFATGTIRPNLDRSTIDARTKVIEKLMELGAKEQLIMYMTGPAGAGKSTSIEVAQQFCFEFCRSLGLLWNSNTFLFTALSGCAAALFGGVTTHSATFLNSQAKNVTMDMIRIWKDVKVLIVDEISFGTVGNMEKMNDMLNMIRRKLMTEMNTPLPANMIFGGYSIIFSGDFHQIPPVGAKSKNTLWQSTGLWDTAINVAIVLDNSHRFKDDPEYGAILKRMWNGTFTKADCDKVNERLIGKSVILPETDMGSDISYACWSNNERTSVKRLIQVFTLYLIQRFSVSDIS